MAAKKARNPATRAVTNCADSRRPPVSPTARSVSAMVARTWRTFQRKRRSMISCITRQKSAAAS